MRPSKIPRPSFSPAQFSHTAASAADKAKFANGLVRFVVGGFNEAQFTRAIYNGLVWHFDFVGDESPGAFYHHRFGDMPLSVARGDHRMQRLVFLVELGQNIESARWRSRWSDVAEALSSDDDWLVATFDQEVAAHQAETETAERAQLGALLARYGMSEQRRSTLITPEGPPPTVPGRSGVVVRRDP